MKVESQCFKCSPMEAMKHVMEKETPKQKKIAPDKLVFRWYFKTDGEWRATSWRRFTEEEAKAMPNDNRIFSIDIRGREIKLVKETTTHEEIL